VLGFRGSVLRKNNVTPELLFKARGARHEEKKEYQNSPFFFLMSLASSLDNQKMAVARPLQNNS
jgi:hypothetical protein